jgi:hypothetical protein
VLELLDWCSSEQDPKHLGDLLWILDGRWGTTAFVVAPGVKKVAALGPESE